MKKLLALSLIISAPVLATGSVCIVCPPGYDCSGDRPVAKTGDDALVRWRDLRGYVEQGTSNFITDTGLEQFVNDRQVVTMADMITYVQANRGQSLEDVKIVPVTIGAGCTDVSKVVLQVNTFTRKGLLSGSTTFNQTSGTKTHNCFTIPGEYKPRSDTGNAKASGVYSFSNSCTACPSACCRDTGHPNSDPGCTLWPVGLPNETSLWDFYYNSCANCSYCNVSKTHTIPTASSTWDF